MRTANPATAPRNDTLIPHWRRTFAIPAARTARPVTGSELGPCSGGQPLPMLARTSSAAIATTPTIASSGICEGQASPTAPGCGVRVRSTRCASAVILRCEPSSSFPRITRSAKGWCSAPTAMVHTRVVARPWEPSPVAARSVIKRSPVPGSTSTRRSMRTAAIVTRLMAPVPTSCSRRVSRPRASRATRCRSQGPSTSPSPSRPRAQTATTRFMAPTRIRT